MRALLDTNIIIHRENDRLSNYSIGHLFRWLDSLQFEKIIHPLSIEEINHYKDPVRKEALSVKLDTYQVLHTNRTHTSSFIELTGSPEKNNNDYIDNCILFELYNHSVDIIITEDKKLRNKAKRLGLGSCVYSIDEFIEWATKEKPALVEYDSLSVEKIHFGDLDLSDPFFNSLRAAYQDFDTWFAMKSDEEAYICRSKEGMLGFLYLKTEGKDENYYNIKPSFSPKKRLKVGTFKTESTGFRLGERFIKIIVDNAINRKVEEIYITLFRESEQLDALVDLISDWGFYYYGIKESASGIEEVYIKDLTTYYSEKSPQYNYPLIRPSNKFLMSIVPKYHTLLFPDSKLVGEKMNNDFKPCMYALEKVYVSWADTSAVKPGDLIMVYRNGETPGRKAYESVITTVCVVDEIIDCFADETDFLRTCQNRSVFSEEELKSFWRNHRYNVKIIRLIYLKSLSKRPNLGFLWDNDIVMKPNGPRGFHQLSDEQFCSILEKAQTSIYSSIKGVK